MGYEYDVFISYTRRNKDVHTWVHEYFYEMFINKLRSTLDKEPKVFIDKSEIEIGEDWAKKIKHKLAKSKLLLCFYVPDYFRSEWCQYEFWSFNHRQIEIKQEKDDYFGGLIWPVQLADGQHNPNYAVIDDIENFYDFFCTSAYFKNSEDFFKMEKKVKSMADKIANRLELSPEWDEKWLSESWWQKTVNQIPDSQRVKFQKPQWVL